MRTLLLGIAATASFGLGGCTTTDDPAVGSALTGAAIGAAGGAIVGEVVGGDPVAGAFGGAIAGAVIGAVIEGRQWYRDRRGDCFYVADGRRVYDYRRRC